jgi:hypothetical protein
MSYGREKYGKVKSHNYNGDYADRKGVEWSKMSSANIGARLKPKGYFFDSTSSAGFDKEDEAYVLLSILNSTIISHYLSFLNPTMVFQVGDVLKVPFNSDDLEKLSALSKQAVDVAKIIWCDNEYAWEYESTSGGDNKSLQESYSKKIDQWYEFFVELHRVEEEINKVITNNHGYLDNQLNIIPLQDITILQQELDRKALAKLNKQLKRDPATGLVTNYDELELPFKRDEIMAQFISYAVGCMLGRYSLDKEGLILANAGDGIREYRDKVGKEEKDWTRRRRHIARAGRRVFSGRHRGAFPRLFAGRLRGGALRREPGLRGGMHR